MCGRCRDSLGATPPRLSEPTTEPIPDDHVMAALPKRTVDASGNEKGRMWMRKFADNCATGTRSEDRDNKILGR